MLERVPRSQVSLDPLIAEARRRARQRRAIALLAFALVLAAAAAWLALRSTGAPETAPPAAVIRPIDSVGTSGGVAWAIDKHGIFWLTLDGGRTWRYTFRHSFEPQVQFVDMRHGWIIDALGSDGPWAIERTVNGGRTWRVSSLPRCGCEPGVLSFYDARHGYVLATPELGKGKPRLFLTDDGGTSWRLVARPPGFGSITFVNRRDGFLSIPPGTTTCNGPMNATCPKGWPAVLYRTTDGGKTWSKQRVPPPTFEGLFITSFGSQLLAAGSKSRIYASPDGGTHWTAIVLPSPAKAALSFAAGSPRMWAFATRRRLYVTHDGGQSWTTIVPRGLPQPLDIDELVFSSPRVGWALEWSHRALYRTTDGGRQWTPSACGRAHLVCPAGG